MASSTTIRRRLGWRRADWPFYAVSAVLAASGLFHLVVFAVDDRLWAGPVSWRKPFDFGLSFGVMLATVTVLTTAFLMSARLRRILITVFAADCVLEVAGVTVQAWRGVPSHLNTGTPTDAAIAYSLAFGGAVLIAVLGTFAVLALRGRVSGPGSRVLAYRAGFVLVLCGLGSGAAMIAVGTVAMRTGPADVAYAVTGFLTSFHAATLHGILVLSLIAYALERWVGDEHVRLRVVRLSVLAYGVAVAALLAIDIAGLVGMRS